ncbi:hypothetical protein DBR37_01975 [Herminiimonas sp. KBW02]|nr:DUF1501 domain-containing protein [Herminiimonas sp. KBW02]RQO36989.1 hypothetical protein DBR37_01975 [Herminiimonas sp. KBW02]
MQRRNFLHMMAATGLLIPVGSSAWAAAGDAQTANKRKLIVVMLRGAVDGLNVVAPYGDPEYARLRPTIGLAAPGQDNGALDLDGYFGLHPALAPLQTLWNEKKLAFVHASGSPDPTRSHFDAQDYMESGTPGKKSTQDGWLNRMLTILPGPVSPTRAISIGPLMPRILTGRASATNLPAGDAGGKANLLDKPQVGNAFDQLYQNNEKFGRTYQDAKDAHKEVMSASLENEMQMANNGAPLPNGFPKDAARLAKLMRSDINIQLAFVALGGWDTHANQGSGTGQLANRLAPLGQGLATLAQQLGPVFQDTSIVVMSEFGRTARQNGNGGTDHGHGNVMWLLGGDIAGGKVYGDWQGLSGGGLHEGRDLPVTTDFRAVLAQIAERHLYLNDKQLGQLFPAGPSFGSNINFMRS